MVGATTSLAPTAVRIGYLDETVTGSRWLFDPNRLPDDLHAGNKLPDDPVDARGAAADIRALGDLLRDTYGVYHRYAKVGLDVPALVERHAARVERLPQVSALDAFRPVFSELRAAVPDHHLVPFLGVALDAVDPQLRFREFRGDPGKLAAAGGVSGAVDATAAVVPLLRSDGTTRRTGTISVMGTQSDAELGALGYLPVEQTAPGSTLTPLGEKAYEYRDAGDTGYIRLTHFDATDEQDARDLARFVADAPRHRKHDRIVLDFRGHGGGSGQYAIDWARQLRARTTPLRSPIAAVDAGTERQQLIQTWNAGTFFSKYVPHHPLVAQMREQAKQARDRWPLPRNQETPEPYPMPANDERGTGPSDWNGDVIVLVDRRSGSAGEFGPLMMKEYLGATIVGERTAGYVESGNMQQYQLSATGLLVGVPSGHNVWRDPAVKEGAGLPVDIALERPGLPAEQIIAAIDRRDAA